MGRLTSKLDEPAEVAGSAKQAALKIDAGLIVLGFLIVVTAYVLAH